MELLNKIALTIVLIAPLAGCGVKGRPLPPLNPAPIGRGEPSYKESTQKKPVKKNNNYRDQEETSETEER